jgi:uncharacterized protein
MSIFLTIIICMVVGDIVWWIAAHRRLHRPWLRVLAGLFIASQLFGLGCILFSRSPGMEWVTTVPRWVSSAIVLWHILLLVPWLLWQLVRGFAFVVGKVRDRFRGNTAVPIHAEPLDAGMSRRQFLTAAATFTPPLLAFGAAAIAEKQLDGFRIRRITLNLSQLPEALDGLTIAHVTDIHVGRFTRGALLEQIAEATNRLNADVVALTGDLINDSLRAMPAAVDLVRALRARHMVVSCEGNHDLIENPREFYRAAEKGGVPLLRGETAAFQVANQRVQVLGLPWSRNEAVMKEDLANLMAKRDPTAWPLLLAHHPHAWDHAGDIPLTLSGHTHGGQLMLNDETGFGPLFYRYWSGAYRRKSRALIVSNGVGNWFPVRIHAPAEILHLTLRRTA